MLPLADLDVAFPIHYELVRLDRIERLGGKSVFAYPGAQPVDRQQELAVTPILEVHPAGGDPWIGVFYGADEYAVPPAVHHAAIAFPDGWTFCVIRSGSGMIVRADDPLTTSEIESWPITGYLVVPDSDLVVFADFTNLVAYGREGIAWRSRRLALDDLKIIRSEDDVLHVTGFFGDLDEEDVPFSVDLRSGEGAGQPWQPPE
jgi:hypothetical protein